MNLAPRSVALALILGLCAAPAVRAEDENFEPDAGEAPLPPPTTAMPRVVEDLGVYVPPPIPSPSSAPEPAAKPPVPAPPAPRKVAKARKTKPKSEKKIGESPARR